MAMIIEPINTFKYFLECIIYNTNIMQAGMAEYALIMGNNINMIETEINFVSDNLMGFDSKIQTKDKIKMIDKIYGGFNWLLGDCIAQNKDSPSKL